MRHTTSKRARAGVPGRSALGCQSAERLSISGKAVPKQVDQRQQAHPYSTSGSGGERGMNPGSVRLVTASMMSEKAMSTPLMATSAQLMCSPTQGSTQMQKMTAGRWAGVPGRQRRTEVS